MSSGVNKGRRTHLPAMKYDRIQEPTSQRGEKQRRRRRGEAERRLSKKLKNRIRLISLEVGKEKSLRETSAACF